MVVVGNGPVAHVGETLALTRSVIVSVAVRSRIMRVFLRQLGGVSVVATALGSHRPSGTVHAVIMNASLTTKLVVTPILLTRVEIVPSVN